MYRPVSWQLYGYRDRFEQHPLPLHVRGLSRDECSDIFRCSRSYECHCKLGRRGYLDDYRQPPERIHRHSYPVDHYKFDRAILLTIGDNDQRRLRLLDTILYWLCRR